MAKILVSLVGTGTIAENDFNNNVYQSTDYIIDSTIYSRETFVANPIINHFNIDKVFFIGTNKSMWDNICNIVGTSDECAMKIYEKKEEATLTQEDLKPLNDFIDKYLKNQGSRCFIVHDGINNEELWSIFEKFLEIIDLIKDGDELYFDITHLFRSLSVMTFVMGQFGQIKKKFHIAGVFYGMLVKDGPSPIINLSIFFELLEWAKAIKNLKEYGNGHDLMQLLNGSDETKEVKNAYSDFAYALSISDMAAMQSSLKRLKGKLKLFEESQNHILRIISEELKSFIKTFDIDSLGDFQMKLTAWYAENKNYSMAYLTLVEGALSIVCEKNNENPTNVEARENAKKEIWSYNRTSREKQKIYDVFKRVNDIRINIAHKVPEEKRRSKSQPKDSAENIVAYIETLKSLKSI